MKGAPVLVVLFFNYFVGVYFGAINLIYTLLLCVSLVVILRHIRRIRYAPVREFRLSSRTPPVSIIIPVFNEEQVVIRSVRSALAADYPAFEVIVVNDGSVDQTLRTVIDAFGLRRTDRVYRTFLKTERVRGFYASPETPNLLVIDKERGGKSDALNCGINASRSPYFCSVDADSLIERDALLRLMVPVIESAVPVVACGGVVRVLNGVRLEDGVTIREIDLPEKRLVLFQIVEYLRGFLFGRVGFDALNSVLILSGAFTLFHKPTVLEAGGFKVGNVSEDMEIIVRLHRHLRGQRKPYRIRFVSDPVCWTEAPQQVRMLARQRRRWHLGLIQTICQYRDMLGNRRYGRIGLLVMPYYVFFEILGPVIEMAGYVMVLSSFALGLLSFPFFLLFLVLALFYGVFLSTAGIFLEELTFRRYPRWKHLFRLLFYGVLENFGYRQMNSFWRLQALMQYLAGKKSWEHVRDRSALASGEAVRR
jgi:cellulose synthase/poly-beta-1,6-N-acetylglucosamine synthase-like glycosyltransferase